MTEKADLPAQTGYPGSMAGFSLAHGFQLTMARNSAPIHKRVDIKLTAGAETWSIIFGSFSQPP